jgi:hypothetical protein
MFVFVINELRGADRRLSEREPAVVGRDLRMRKHVEMFGFEAAHDLLEQDAVLEAAT